MTGRLSAWVACGLLALSFAAGAVAQPDEQQGPPPALVRTGEVRQMELQDRWDVVGRLRETRRANVPAEQEGRIVRMEVDQGDLVVGGETLVAQVDDMWARMRLDVANARLKQYDAEVNVAEAALSTARRELKYLEELLLQNSARPKEVEDARSIVTAEEARVAARTAEVNTQQAEIARLMEDIQRLRVVAPFDGVVVRKHAKLGQWATPGEPIVEIISFSPIDAVIDVPERMIQHIRPGYALDVMVEPLNQLVTGEVIAVVPDAARAARTFPVKVRIDNDDMMFKPGMSVRAMVPMSERTTFLTVPRDAVRQTAMGVVVWANLNGAATPVPVEVLFGQNQVWAVRGVAGAQPSLQVGMQVVTEGAARLFPGQPLTVLPPEEPTSGAAAATRSGAADDPRMN